MKQPHYRLILTITVTLGTLIALFGLFQPQHATGAFTTIYPLFAVRDSTLTTVLDFFNPGDTPADLTLAFGAASAQFTIPAKGTLMLRDSDFPQVDPGRYAVFATSGQPIVGKAAVYTYPETLLGIYRGMEPGLGQAGPQYTLHFGPLSQDSVLKLVNGGGAEAQIEVGFYNPSGMKVCIMTPSIAAGQSLDILAKDCQSQSLSGGRITVLSDQPLAGLMDNPSLFFAGYDTQQPAVYEPLQLAENANALYRFFTANVNGTLPLEYSTYSQYYMASNTGSGMAHVTSNLYREDGSILDTNTVALTPNASQFMLPAGTPSPLQTGPRQAGMAVSADQPLAYGSKVIANPTRVPNYSFASYAADGYPLGGGQGTVLLPGLVNNDHTKNTLTLLNQSESSAATVILKLYSADGSLAGQDALDLGPRHWKRYNLAVFPNLRFPFAGSAVITSTQPVNVVVDAVNQANIASCAPVVTLTNSAHDPVSVFDLVTFTADVASPEPATLWWKVNGTSMGVYSYTTHAQYLRNFDEGEQTVSVTAYTACGQSTASNTLSVGCVAPQVSLEQSPVGVIYAGDTVHFLGVAIGSQPLSFSWSVDGQPTVSGTQLDRAFAVGNHTVTFTASNPCGEFGSAGNSTHSFTVLDPPVSAADLSLSTLEASTPGVQSEDEIQYTAILRNSGQTASPVSSFNNPLPDVLEYLPDSAQASDGSPVSYDPAMRALAWTGAVDPGSPVIITYKARVSGEPPADGHIVNTAQVVDASGTSTPLTSRIPYRRGYRLFINDGALATGSLQVDLTFTYDAALDNVQSYRLSNNDAFDASGSATDWLPLTNSPQTHTGWQLDPYGDPRMPRSVYITFRTAGLAEIGPFSASILYDVQPPAAPVIQADSPAQALWLLHPGGAQSPARFTVTTTDDNSGVAALLIRGGSSTEMVFPTTGRVTTVDWSLAGLGTVQVRARDRSGNVGPAALFNVGQQMYLPLINR